MRPWLAGILVGVRLVASVAAIGVLVLVVGCEAEAPAVFTMPVPEGTTVIERPAVPEGERSGNVIDLREDLVITGTSKRPDDIFLRTVDLAVAADGSIYVYDKGRFAIQEFSRDGAHLHTYGGVRGEGPGDLGERGQIAVAGDRLLYVEDARLARWNLATRELEYAARLPIGTPILYAHGTDAGEIVLAFHRSLMAGRYALGIAAFDPDGTELVRYGVFEKPDTVFFNRTDGGLHLVSTGISRGEVDVVVARDATVYVTIGDEYQVLSLGIDGRPRWALRVDVDREPFTDEDIERGRAHAAEISDIRGLAADWPEELPALSVTDVRPGVSYSYGRGHPIRVDGRGNLYVFPHERGAPEQRAVDVYSPEGDLIFAGTMPNVSWVASRGDRIYGIVTEASGDQRVVRYRLEIPLR